MIPKAQGTEISNPQIVKRNKYAKPRGERRRGHDAEQNTAARCEAAAQRRDAKLREQKKPYGTAQISVRLRCAPDVEQK